MNVDLPAFTFASNDQQEPLPLQQRKRPLHQDDPFFQEGTYEYKAAWKRLEDENAYIPDLSDSDTDNGTGIDYSHRLYGDPNCNLFSPCAVLLTTTDVQQHFFPQI